MKTETSNTTTLVKKANRSMSRAHSAVHATRRPAAGTAPITVISTCERNWLGLDYGTNPAFATKHQRPPEASM